MKTKLDNQTDNTHKMDLINQLYGIIDSKIQYIDYQTEMVTSSFVDLNSLSMDNQKDTLGHGIRVMESIMANNSRILEKISEFSTTTKLLLIIRTQLNTINANHILDLLTDNKFTAMNDIQLVELLDSIES